MGQKGECKGQKDGDELGQMERVAFGTFKDDGGGHMQEHTQSQRRQFPFRRLEKSHLIGQQDSADRHTAK